MITKLESPEFFGMKKCTYNFCNNEPEIELWGCASDDGFITVCQNHALQIARKLLEDLCACRGARHG